MSIFSEKPYPAGRLFCLDVLRGLDMMLLTVIGPLVNAFNKSWALGHDGKGLSDAFMRQFNHGWEGFTLWDIIMPLFIFMCGAAIPFALPKRMENGRAGWGYWRHVLGRVALLWFCGMLVQGSLCSLDPMKIKVFSNTLQSIAVGYFATACVLLVPRRGVRIAIPVSLTVLYALLLHFGGDYTQHGNFTVGFDRTVFSWLLPEGNDALTYLSPNGSSTYTWVLPSMMFAVMTLAGYHAAEILRSGLEKWTKAKAMFAYGGGMLAAGWILSLWVPVIKPIYTVSFTLQALGWCTLALGALFVVNDILQVRRGFALVVLFGQFALTAYLLSHEPFRPALAGLVGSLTRGFPLVFGKVAQPFLTEIVFSVALTFALLVRRSVKTRD